MFVFSACCMLWCVTYKHTIYCGLPIMQQHHSKSGQDPLIFEIRSKGLRTLSRIMHIMFVFSACCMLWCVTYKHTIYCGLPIMQQHHYLNLTLTCNNLTLYVHIAHFYMPGYVHFVYSYSLNQAATYCGG